jgi:hypothetical protein
MVTRMIRYFLALALAALSFLPFLSKETHSPEGAAGVAPPTRYAAHFPHNDEPMPEDPGIYLSRQAAEGTATLPAGPATPLM